MHDECVTDGYLARALFVSMRRGEHKSARDATKAVRVKQYRDDRVFGWTIATPQLIGLRVFASLKVKALSSQHDVETLEQLRPLHQEARLRFNVREP